MAVAVGVGAGGHGVVGFYVDEEVDGFSVYQFGVGAYFEDGAGEHGFGALGGVAEEEYGLAE